MAVRGLRNKPFPLRKKKIRWYTRKKQSVGKGASLNLRFSQCTRYAVVLVRNLVSCVMESTKIVLEKRELRRIFGPEIK
jgi:hypothetical protein